MNGRPDVQLFDLDIPQLRGDLWQDVVRAQLFLHLPKAPSVKDSQAWIDILMGIYDKYGKASFKKEMEVLVDLDPESAGWVEINATDMVTAWLRNPYENMGVAFDATTKNGQLNIPVGIQTQHGNGVNVSLIFLCPFSNLF